VDPSRSGAATFDDAPPDIGAGDDRLPVVADRLRAAAARYGTPLYLTDQAAIDGAIAELAAAFPDPWIRQYSVKANDVSRVVALATAASAGMGANVVSRGEWAVARKAGVPNARISLEGVGKTDADLGAAVRAAALGDPLMWVALESADEADALIVRALRAGLGRSGRPALDVLLRLNPDVSPETHAGLAVGAGASKFGMTETELTATIERLAATEGAIRPRGIHVHVGSQLGAVDAWRDAVRRGLAVLGLLRGGLSDVDTLDLGGGFAVPPFGTPGPGPGRFARELPALLEAIPVDRRPRRLAIEPGRFVVARAGWLVGSVLHVRERAGTQVVLDTGMTELIRPALYGGRHAIVALTSLGRPVDVPGTDRGASPLSRASVHGPICESTDELAEHDLPELRRGDLVAIRDAGAYATSMASTYNGRPRPPQVILTTDGQVTLARRRGSVAGLG
jgi:diaminopimelate decarboxylase